MKSALVSTVGELRVSRDLARSLTIGHMWLIVHMAVMAVFTTVLLILDTLCWSILFMRFVWYCAVLHLCSLVNNHSVILGLMIFCWNGSLYWNPRKMCITASCISYWQAFKRFGLFRSALLKSLFSIIIWLLTSIFFLKRLIKFPSFVLHEFWFFVNLFPHF